MEEMANKEAQKSGTATFSDKPKLKKLGETAHQIKRYKLESNCIVGSTTYLLILHNSPCTH